MNLKRGYELSLAADQDLEDIFDYTYKQFGEQQAIKYLSELDMLFLELAVNPDIGKARNEIKPGLRSFSKQAHIIFYRKVKRQIRIVRILHGSRDIARFFG